MTIGPGHLTPGDDEPDRYGAHHQSADRPEIEPGLLVVGGARSLADADPAAGWLDDVDPGTMQSLVILQTKVWVDVDGRARRLEDLASEERAALIRHLSGDERVWTLAAGAKVLSNLKMRLISPVEARAMMDALAALGDGWMDRTPLVRRLRELNAGPARPRPVDPEREGPDLRSFAPSPTQELLGHESGLWRITTEVSIYLLDLDRREILRMGAATSDTHVADDGEIVWARRFDTDHQSHTLERLERCRIGEPMSGIQIIDRQLQPFRSTFVTRIERIEPP